MFFCLYYYQRQFASEGFKKTTRIEDLAPFAAARPIRCSCSSQLIICALFASPILPSNVPGNRSPCCLVRNSRANLTPPRGLGALRGRRYFGRGAGFGVRSRSATRPIHCSCPSQFISGALFESPIPPLNLPGNRSPCCLVRNSRANLTPPRGLEPRTWWLQVSRNYSRTWTISLPWLAL